MQLQQFDNRGNLTQPEWDNTPPKNMVCNQNTSKREASTSSNETASTSSIVNGCPLRDRRKRWQNPSLLTTSRHPHHLNSITSANSSDVHPMSGDPPLACHGHGLAASLFKHLSESSKLFPQIHWRASSEPTTTSLEHLLDSHMNKQSKDLQRRWLMGSPEAPRQPRLDRS